VAVDRFFDSAGVALHYIEAGSGEPVVLLHSFCGNAERDFVVPGLFAALALRFRVVALDLRGHGSSGKPHDPRQYGRALALDVVRLLDHLRLAKAHIAGYSLGGHVVAQLLSLHPQRFITATLGGSCGRHAWCDDDDRRVAVEAAEMARGELRTQLLRLWPTSQRPTEAQIRARTAEILEGNDPKALAALRLANADQVVSDEALAGANVPTLGLVGSNDRYRDAFRELCKCMPGMVLVEIEGATHDDALVRAEFREALIAFATAHSQGR
jgi:pimeloyl-ACP methyl ester carboxylesterase